MRDRLAAEGDPERAVKMQRYMRSELPYHGVLAADQKRIYRELFEARPLATAEEWRDEAGAIWRAARYREERYAAIALTGLARYDDFQTLEALPLYEEFVVTGAWWDYVDWVAKHRLGGLLRRFPEEIAHAMRRWARDPHLWRRRSAILCQLGRKGETDVRLLSDCIEPSVADREFFIRKAIGWALREHSKTDADWVVRYVGEHEGEMSPLSRREALSWLAHHDRLPGADR